MTTQQSFKRRVRTRMEKTGESYTAARAQLIPDAEPEWEARISAEKVRERTGRTWNQWFTLLDEWGGAQREHGEIAAWLGAEHGVPGWWAQGITVEYEKARGLRPPGGDRDGTMNAGASKTVAVPVERLYEAFVELGAARAVAAERAAEPAHRPAAPHRPLRLGRRHDARDRRLPGQGRRQEHGRDLARAVARQRVGGADEGLLARAAGGPEGGARGVDARANVNCAGWGGWRAGPRGRISAAGVVYESIGPIGSPTRRVGLSPSNTRFSNPTPARGVACARIPCTNRPTADQPRRLHRSLTQPQFAEPAAARVSRRRTAPGRPIRHCHGVTRAPCPACAWPWRARPSPRRAAATSRRLSSHRRMRPEGCFGSVMSRSSRPRPVRGYASARRASSPGAGRRRRCRPAARPLRRARRRSRRSRRARRSCASPGARSGSPRACRRDPGAGSR